MQKLGIMLLLVSVCSSLFANSGHADERPNIVVIISDDQGFGDYGFMGHPTVQTPNLDRLAKESLVFDRGYVTSALCNPSLASLLTGVYPHQHGYTGNDAIKGSRDAWKTWVDHFKKSPQMPAFLKDAGYLTMHTGKYWQQDPANSGFTDGMGPTLRHGSKESLSIGREGLQPIYDFIEKADQQEKPFLVWYAPFMPHTPHTPPQRLLDKYKQKTVNEGVAKYFGMVEWFDETCGELLDHLDEKKLSENTVILYVCDNGWGQGVPGFRGHKLTPWEQGIRTPIMIRWPAKVRPARNRHHAVSSLDIPVTALSAAGIPVPKAMEGINLLDGKSLMEREAVFIEDFAHDMVAPDQPERTLEARAVISGFWKLLVTYRENKQNQREVDRIFLFDLRDDPKEQFNVVTENPGRTAKLLRMLNKWWDPSMTPTTRLPGEPITKQFIYRTVGEHDLKMKLWYPTNWKSDGPKLPASVLIFGGGWYTGDVSQFNGVAPYLAKRGMIIVAPEYRTGEDGATPYQCLEDSKSAMRYVYSNANELGIDATKVSAGGRSAGGHLAAAVTFCKGFNAEGDDTSVRSDASALILFNPVIDNGPGGFRHHDVKDYWEQFSPLHNIPQNPVPTIFFTGDKDQYTPIETAKKYQAEMQKKGGECELVVFENAVHGSPFHQEHYPRTLEAMDAFLVRIGHLKPKQSNK